MSFNSFAFAVFLPVVFLLYWAFPRRHRWILLLAASYYFYLSWSPQYVLLVFFTTVLSYGTALLIEHSDSRKKKKLYMLTALFVSLGILFLFKYFNFFSSSLTSFLQSLSIPVQPITLKLMLPIGISFYTFQTLSYVIDVYRGDVKAERHFGIYAVFVSFFPQIVAGPITRSHVLIPQLKKKRRFRYKQATYGIKQMAWGFFKKIVIADGLSVYVNQVYGDLPQYAGFPILLAVVFFSIQIYCDFSGYSDIAIGTAKLFGIDLMANFKSPYFSSSIKEFWGRWHISLSTWFRDYVYIPLGGNRVSPLRHWMNVIITFLVSGLWHGANWTYIFWGFLHGLLQIPESFLPWNQKNHPIRSKKTSMFFIRLVMVPITFIVVSLVWVFFKAESIQDGFFVLTHMFTGISDGITYLKGLSYQLNITAAHLIWSCFPIIFLFIFDLFSLKTDVIKAISRQRFFIRWPIYILLLLAILLFSEKGVATEFIYAQF